MTSRISNTAPRKTYEFFPFLIIKYTVLIIDVNFVTGLRTNLAQATLTCGLFWPEDNSAQNTQGELPFYCLQDCGSVWSWERTITRSNYEVWARCGKLEGARGAPSDFSLCLLFSTMPGCICLVNISSPHLPMNCLPFEAQTSALLPREFKPQLPECWRGSPVLMRLLSRTKVNVFVLLICPMST